MLPKTNQGKYLSCSDCLWSLMSAGEVSNAIASPCVHGGCK